MVHNVLSMDAMLMDGTSATFTEVSKMSMAPPRVRNILHRVAAIAERERDEIEKRVPAVLRRVGGYNLDIYYPQSPRPYGPPGTVNMAHLLVGSEGTLAYTRQITLKLSPLPASKVLGVVNFPHLYQAMDMTRHIVKLGPCAVELVDRTMIDLALSNPAFRPVIKKRYVTSREAILLVEFASDDSSRDQACLRQWWK